MRIQVGLPLAAVCLALIGCAAPGSKKNPTDDANSPFMGTKLTNPSRDPSSPPAEVDVLLAGQVVEKAFGKRVPNASIQVVDLEDANAASAARLDVRANSDGYFFIPGLQRGHHYQLIGRVKDGDHLLSGITLASPPNPRLAIYLSEDLSTPSTPAPLAAPTPPAADKGAAPSAILSPPKTNPAPTNPGFSGDPPLNRIADGPQPETGGFSKAPLPPTATIPNGTGNPILPPPPSFSGQPQPTPSAPTSAPPADQTRRDAPPPRTAPPFCVLEGSRLDNFALPTLEGGSWEFRRDPSRKLVLLDFWKSNCGPCLAAIPRLERLQEKYGGDGLEVVGIAYEDEGPAAQQNLNVRSARARLHMNYTILMGADSRSGPCPVRSQFLVDRFPTLVLIDGNGEILWRSSPQGLSDQAFRELDAWIDRQLHAPSK